MLVKEIVDSCSLRRRKIWSGNRIWQHLTCLLLQGLFHTQGFHNMQYFAILFRNVYHFFIILLMGNKAFHAVKITKSKPYSSWASIWKHSILSSPAALLTVHIDSVLLGLLPRSFCYFLIRSGFQTPPSCWRRPVSNDGSGWLANRWQLGRCLSRTHLSDFDGSLVFRKLGAPVCWFECISTTRIGEIQLLLA